MLGAATGAFAEYVTVNAERAVVHKPANIRFEQAVSVTIAGTPELRALRDKGKLEADPFPRLEGYKPEETIQPPLDDRSMVFAGYRRSLAQSVISLKPPTVAAICS